MTDKARRALSVIRNIAADIRDEGYPVTEGYLLRRADTLEAELRRCRAETLREAASVISKIRRKSDPVDFQMVRELHRMADEAEREADHDA